MLVNHNRASVTRVSDALNALGHNNKVDLIWIRAHKNAVGNEAADMAAKKGSASRRFVPSHTFHHAKATIWAILKHSTLKVWEQRWTNYAKSHARQTNYFYTKPDSGKAKLLLQYSRDTVGRFVRFTTGHAFLNRHNEVVLQGSNQPVTGVLCRNCDIGKEETPVHIIPECTHFNFWRFNCFGQFQLQPWDFPTMDWQVPEVVKFLSEHDILLLEDDI